MIRAIAIDDEPLALRVIENHASRIPFLDLVKTTTKVMEALVLIQQQAIDLVFLDIQMPELTGMQFMKLIRGRAKVILTTAYEEYALDSYEYDVVDYLLKPILFERFLKASQKALDALSGPGVPPTSSASPEEGPPTPALQAGPASGHDFVFVKTEHRLRKILLAELLFIEGGKDYITIHTTKEKVLCLSSLTKMQESLPYPRFMRVHKSFLVALDKIETIERQRIFIGREVIPVGDMYKAAFLKQIGDGV